MAESPESKDTPRWKRFGELIREDLKSTESGRSQLKEKIRELDSMWEGKRTRKAYAGRANVSVPFPYTYSESMIPRLMSSVFGGRDIIEVLSRGTGTPRGARAHKALINYQLLFEMDFFIKFLQFCASVTRKSMGVAKIRWDVERGAPQWHNINPEQFAIDQRATTINESQWLAHGVTKTRQELEIGVVNRGYDREAVGEILKKDAKTTTEDGSQVPEQRRFYEMWEWWGLADPDGNGIRPCIALFGEDQLVKWVESPYEELRPFVAMSDVVEPRRFSGHSELSPIQGIWNASCDVLNQRLDNVTMNINRLWTVLKGSNIRRDKLVGVPWGYVEVTAHDDLKSWPSENVTADAHREVEGLVSAMKDSTGLVDQLRGVDNPSTDTATGMQLIVSQANMRPGLKVQTLQYQVIMKMAQIMIRENQMFLDKNKAVLIVGEADPARAALSVSPQVIQGQYDVLPLGASIAGSRDTRIGQLTNILNVLRGYEQRGLNPLPIIREMMSLTEIRNGEEVTRAWEQMQQAQKQVALQTPAQASGTAPPQPTASPVGMPGVSNVPGQLPAGTQSPGGF